MLVPFSEFCCYAMQDGVAKLLEVVLMPAIKESLKDFSTQDHILTEVQQLLEYSTTCGDTSVYVCGCRRNWLVMR